MGSGGYWGGAFLFFAQEADLLTAVEVDGPVGGGVDVVEAEGLGEGAPVPVGLLDALGDAGFFGGDNAALCPGLRWEAGRVCALGGQAVGEESGVVVGDGVFDAVGDNGGGVAALLLDEGGPALSGVVAAGFAFVGEPGVEGEAVVVGEVVWVFGGLETPPLFFFRWSIDPPLAVV